MRFDWRSYAVRGAVMGAEACALYVLLALLNEGGASGRLSVLQLMLCFPAAFTFSALLRLPRWPRRITRPVNTLAWLAVTLLMAKVQLFGGVSVTDPAWLVAILIALGNFLYSFPPELTLLISSAIAWWLGWRLANIHPRFTTALAEFQFGLAVMLIMFFITGASGSLVAGSVTVTLAFFVFALLGISIAHSGEGKGWFSRLQGQWPGLLLVNIGLVLVLGLIITVLVTPDFLLLIWHGIAWCASQVFRLLVFLVSLLPQPGPAEPIPGFNMTGPGGGEGTFSFNIPEQLLSGLRWGWNVLFIGLFLIALWRISSQIAGWLKGRMATSANGEVERMPGAFKADLFGFLKRIFMRLFRMRFPAGQKKIEPPEVASIRNIYRQLLRWAAAGGSQRPRSQTPYEFLPALEKLLPGCAGDFRLITQGYVSARYGEHLPTAGELAVLRQSWHEITHYRAGRAKGLPDRVE